MKDILLSFSGGKTSAFMTYQCLREIDANFLIVFANTGEEREETLEFVNQCDRLLFGNRLVWVEAKVNPIKGKATSHNVVSFDSASRDGYPFEQVIKKYGIPNVTFPHCTRELKLRPIESYAFKYFGHKKYTRYVGIRADEIDRMRTNPLIEYPLVNWNITKQDVNSFWESMPFNLQLEEHEGNCKVCYKKSKRKLLMLAKQDPSLFNFFQQMENKYSNYCPSGKSPEKYKLPVAFFRENLTSAELIEMAKSKVEDNQLELDLDYHCGNSTCEAF